MRSPGEVKTALIQLRWGKKLPLVKIAKDSGCTPRQLMDAMQMTASETICRRIDAYLDAKHLHVYEKSTKLLYKIEQMREELWREFKAKSLPMRDVQLMPKDRQIRLANAMDWRLKRLLREKVEKEHQIQIHFEDSASYWRCKAKILTREGKLAPHRKSPYRYGPRAVGEKLDLQPGANKNRKPARVLG